MPQGSLRVNKPLTNISVRYSNEEYIAGELLKNVPVKNESDIYYVYNNDFRLEQTNRANKSPANMVTWDVSTSTYSLTEHALKDVITKRDRNNVDNPLQLDRDTTEYLTDKILMRTEFDAHKLLFTTTSFSQNATLGTATSWAFNTTTSNPVGAVLSATTRILTQGGGKATHLGTSKAVYDELRENDNLFERIKYVERAILTPDILASLFDLEKVVVGSASYNSSKEGQASSITAIWGNDAIIARIDKSPRLKTKTAFATLRQTQFGNPMRVKKWHEEDVDGDYIEVQTMYQHKLIATISAYLFKTVILR
jgi:hypothetical protein